MAGEHASTKAAEEAAAAVQEATVVGSKRKAEVVADAKVEEEEQAAGAAGDETLILAPGEIYVDPSTGIKWVDMPESYLSWVLSQKRRPLFTYDPRQFTWMSPEEIEREVEVVERLDAWKAGVRGEEFFGFQAWVRETYETKGRVLVPVDSIPDRSVHR